MTFAPRTETEEEGLVYGIVFGQDMNVRTELTLW